MKKLNLLLGMLFMSAFIFAQDANTVNTNDHIVNSGLQTGIIAIEEGIINIQEIIDEKEEQIETLSNLKLNLTVQEEKDNIDLLIGINEEIIENLESAIEELEDADEEIDFLEIIFNCNNC